ncbi:hypothetical protein EYF80_054049 [Liparis tanakae]|uniref:Uncharacterized protein n=1 Tax=Liparis tanakae TaxID=230148 RepID=A0A4Z2F3U9_9TELE|nr:hypothetical protein EYF80_054049 [Liparis tanakae]
MREGAWPDTFTTLTPGTPRRDGVHHHTDEASRPNNISDTRQPERRLLGETDTSCFLRHSGWRIVLITLAECLASGPSQEPSLSAGTEICGRGSETLTEQEAVQSAAASTPPSGPSTCTPPSTFRADADSRRRNGGGLSGLVCLWTRPPAARRCGPRRTLRRRTDALLRAEARGPQALQPGARSPSDELYDDGSRHSEHS